MQVEFHPAARAEYNRTVVRYEGQRRGLGQRFVAAIEETTARIARAPQEFPIHKHGARRALAHVFPYAIIFTIEIDWVLIVAVMHCHRKPGYWKRRLGKGR